MKRNRAYVCTMLVATPVLLGVLTIVAWFLERHLFWVGAALTVISAVLAVLFNVYAYLAHKNYLQQIAKRLRREDRTALTEFPLPVLVGSADGTVLWYNDLFRSRILNGLEIYGDSLSNMTGGVPLTDIQKKSVLDVSYGGKKYNVYVSTVQENEDADLIILYYVDNTRLKEIAEEYSASRPVILSVFIDNLEEFSADLRARERAQVAADVESLLEDWLGKGAALLQRYENDRFLIITENRHLEEMIQNRFRVLDTVRAMQGGVHKNITLSIGVGQGETVLMAKEAASKALEMALGRGGDQAAVKTKNGYDFYGGVSKGVERRTKVRTRMVASALLELIQNSSKVLIMGHMFSDMDSVGSAAALALIARKHGKSAYVVINSQQTLANEMVTYLHEADSTLFLEPNDAEILLDGETLVIVTDTHHPERVESPRLLERAKVVAVIDHHRRMVNGIEGAWLFYHEPTASSASEMVAELLQYMGDPAPGKTEAEALLAGMILDTRNFVLKAGARTFEAAAYLRRLGADTVKVQGLFAAGMELYREKATLVSNAEIYKSMAISCGTGNSADSRIAASQAANELLTIRGVIAAFTLINTDDGVNVSARSMGEVNVQLIMEAMGGGGHLTMAGAFLKGMDIVQVTEQLKTAIDTHLQNMQR